MNKYCKTILFISVQLIILKEVYAEDRRVVAVHMGAGHIRRPPQDINEIHKRIEFDRLVARLRYQKSHKIERTISSLTPKVKWFGDVRDNY